MRCSSLKPKWNYDASPAVSQSWSFCFLWVTSVSVLLLTLIWWEDVFQKSYKILRLIQAIDSIILRRLRNLRSINTGIVKCLSKSTYGLSEILAFSAIRPIHKTSVIWSCTLVSSKSVLFISKVISVGFSVSWSVPSTSTLPIGLAVNSFSDLFLHSVMPPPPLM